MSEGLTNLYRIHVEGHAKYVYFLLAATGAALGYALQQLNSAVVNGLVWFGLAAILAWLCSFFFGCAHITKIQGAISSNYQLLQLRQGNHSMQPSSPQELEIALRSMSEAMERKNGKAQIYFRCQFWFLAIGVLLFAAWRVSELFGGVSRVAP